MGKGGDAMFADLSLLAALRGIVAPRVPVRREKPPARKVDPRRDSNAPQNQERERPAQDERLNRYA